MQLNDECGDARNLVVTTSSLRLIAIKFIRVYEMDEGRNYLISEAHCNATAADFDSMRKVVTTSSLRLIAISMRSGRIKNSRRNYLISEAHCNLLRASTRP